MLSPRPANFDSPKKQIGKKEEEAYPCTPTKKTLTGFITSSPRSPRVKGQDTAAKNARLALHRKRSPNSPSKGALFSPMYHAAEHVQEVAAAPPPPPPRPELSAVQKRLQENVARYGHVAQEFDQYSDDDFDPYRFIASLPTLQSDPFRQPCLPRKAAGAPPVTLVLDLDETLVHCSTDPNDVSNPDFSFEVVFNEHTYQVFAKKRPGFEEFLHHVRGKFETVIFTASQRVYADKLLDILDPTHELIQHRVFRDDCTCVEGNYLKDLAVLGRDLSSTVIVDNSPQAFAFQLNNGIPILSWFESDDDRELYKLIPLLDVLATCTDVRPILCNKFALWKKVDSKRRMLW